MEFIKQVLNKTHPPLDQLLECFGKIKDQGDVVVIKMDGERKEDQYTVFISPQSKSVKDLIRSDKNNLTVAIVEVLTKYIELYYH